MFDRTLLTLTLSLIFFVTITPLHAKPHIEALLTAIERDIKAQRISTPPGNNALSKIDLAKELYPNDFRVNKFVYQIAEIYISFANRAMDENELKRAQKHLTKAENIAALAKGLNQAWARLQALSNNKIQRVAQKPKPSTPKKPTNLAAKNPKPKSSQSTASKKKPSTSSVSKPKPKPLTEVTSVQKTPVKAKPVKKPLAPPKKKPAKEKPTADTSSKIAQASTPEQTSIKTGPVEWKKELSKPIATFPVNQNLINERNKDGIIQSMSSACKNIVDKEASVVLHTKSIQDYRWLTVRLILCTRRLEPGFRLRHSNIIASSASPKISLHPPREGALGFVQK